jgi:putative transposase
MSSSRRIRQKGFSAFAFLSPPDLLTKAAKADYGRKTSPSESVTGIIYQETSEMKKRYSGPQIVAKLREADILIGQGKTVPDVCREIEVSQQTYYRWRQKYGGMSPEMIKELKGFQKENARLRRIIADQALDMAILKEVNSKNS